MQEQENSNVIGVEILNPKIYEQRVNIRDGHREVLISHNIYSIGSRPYLKYFDADKEGLGSYHMFGSTIGYPRTTSVGNIPEDFKDSDLRFRLNCIAEEEFFEQYFDSMREKKAYLRYIHDFGFDDWYERNIEELVEKLKDRRIPVEILYESHSEDGIYHALLLFKDRTIN